MGSPAGASTNNPGASASVYTPTGQPAADTSIQNLINSFPSATGSPAGNYYPIGQGALSTYGFNYPAIDSALKAGDFAQGFDQNTAFPQATGQSTDIAGASWAGLPYAGTALSEGFDPQYTKNVTAAENNPYYDAAQTGAQQGAMIGTAAAPVIGNAAYRGLDAAKQTLNTAYDPQNALYNRGRTDALDYAGVTGAMSGIGGTPYGASVASRALTNYDLDWGDRQLGRQEKALGTYGTAVTDAGNQLSGASKLADTAAAYPSATFTGNLKDINAELAARNTGAAVGGSTYGSVLGASGTADTTAAKLDSGALADYSTYGKLPYTTSEGVSSDLLSGLDKTTNLGNNQYLLPQQSINDLESYLGLGQSASTISGNLGATGLSELGSAASGIGGLASGANSLFGGSGAASGTGGLFSAGGLLGSQGPLFGTAADASIASGGPPLAAALPLAAS